MTKSAVVMPNWVGDFVMALCVVESSARRGDVTMVVPQQLVALATALSSIPVIPYQRSTLGSWLATARTLRRNRFDTVYLLPHSFSSALLGFLAGARRVRGVMRERREILLSDPLPRRTRSSKRHITCEYATVLESEPPAVDRWEGVQVGTAPEYAGATVLCPGAQYGPAKQWPYFAELAGRLPGKIVVVGGKGENSQGELIAHAAGERGQNLAGKTSLVEVASILASASCVVSNDSGLMHVAGYVGAPTVGIFGSTRPSWTRPLGHRVEVLYAAVPCSPCFERTCRFGHFECLRTIQIDSVVAAVERVRRGSTR